MTQINFKPKQVVKKLLAVLPERNFDVIVNRFGLGESSEAKTLDAIGKKYGITRERVRQIENFSLQSIKKSEVFEKEKEAFENLFSAVQALGAVVSEDELLSHFSDDKATQNHINFFLVLGDAFVRAKEDGHFKHRWTVDSEVSEKVHNSLKKLYEGLSDEEIVPESELVTRFLGHLKDVSEKYRDEEILKRWLKLSKLIDRNPFGEWGRASSSNIRARGMRDYAYLVLRRHGSPMHFSEVAKAITTSFKKKAHVATCHNELIKDKRFVLVGRGLYALSEWGYNKGVVRDVIRELLKKEGPMSREDILKRVMKERYVKENTVLVNLQNTNNFKKNKNGLYVAV